MKYFFGAMAVIWTAFLVMAVFDGARHHDVATMLIITLLYLILARQP